MKTTNKKLYMLISLVIIIVGIIVWKINGFNLELQYSNRKQIQLTNASGVNISEIDEIAGEVLNDTRFFVQSVETFGNSVSVVADEITEEQRNQMVEKFNEKYHENDEDKIENNDVEIISIKFTRVKDIIKPVIVPGIIILIVLTIYFAIRFNKLGLEKVLPETLLTPIIAEFVLYSVIAITRIPFGRTTIAIGVGLYAITIFALTSKFEKQRREYMEKLQNNNK